MTAKTAHCRKCGAPFAASPAGTTVHCPEHRGRRPAAAAGAGRCAIETCRCGKTVTAGPGVPAGVRCPRAC